MIPDAVLLKMVYLLKDTQLCRWTFEEAVRYDVRVLLCWHRPCGHRTHQWIDEKLILDKGLTIDEFVKEMIYSADMWFNCSTQPVLKNCACLGNGSEMQSDFDWNKEFEL